MDCTQIPIRSIRKPRRVRSAFTTEQVLFLEQQYKKFPYIGTEYRKVVASALNIQDRAVKIWFQNRRMREKKELKEDASKADKAQDDQLSNLPANNQLPYSFKVSPMTANVPYEARVKEENTSIKQKTKSNTVPDTPLDFKTNVAFHPVITSSKSPLNLKKCSFVPVQLCKKNKIPKTTETQQRKIPQNLQRINQCPKNTKLSDFGQIKTRKALGTNVKTFKLKQSYFPVMKTLYAHPMSPSGPGVVWKPMNVISMPSPTFYSGVEPTCRVQKSCNCNCHARHMAPVYGPGVNINNSPYHQYVISMPYHNQSPRV